MTGRVVFELRVTEKVDSWGNRVFELDTKEAPREQDRIRLVLTDLAASYGSPSVYPTVWNRRDFYGEIK